MGKTLGSARHKALVEFLVAKREAMGITQTDLANQMGEYQSFVARLESGQRRIDIIEFLELSRLLSFDPVKAIRLIEHQD